MIPGSELCTCQTYKERLIPTTSLRQELFVPLTNEETSCGEAEELAKDIGTGCSAAGIQGD